MGTQLVVSRLTLLVLLTFGLGMYLRTTQRRNRDGSVVRYVQLAHNHRKDGVTQAQVLLNLGREDALDREGLARLVASINRYLGEAGGPGLGDVVGDNLTVTGARPLGTVWLLDGLWRQLGVDAELRGVLGGTQVHHGRGAGAVRAGGEPGGRPLLEVVCRAFLGQHCCWVLGR